VDVNDAVWIGIDKKAWYQRQEACQYDKVDAVFLE